MSGTQDAILEGNPGSVSGYRSLKLFLLSTFCALGVVVAVGWFTSLKQVMHGALVATAVFAFLPFAIIATGLAIAGFFMGMSLIAAILGGGGDIVGMELAEPFTEAGVRSIPPYYRWLARQRHPVFWGIPAGVLFGGLLLWGFIAVLILPGEVRTVQTLAEVREDIERTYREEGRYPRPEHGNRLTYAALNRSDRTGVVTDGFDRPIEYGVAGRWKVASYRLRSYGYDGAQGRDDFCVSGATKLARLSSLIHRGGTNGRVSVVLKLQAIRDLTCDD